MNTILEKPDQLFVESPTFQEYHQMVIDLLEEGKVTGLNQTEANLGYTRQNLQRVKRSGKTTRISEDVQSYFENLKGRYNWLVITEGWCGDAAVTVPVMQLLADISPNIELRVTLRDEHPTLMEQFLTNGAMAIPVLIVMDAESGEVMGSWKPRPKEAQDMRVNMLADGVPGAEVTYSLQKWYAKDRGKSTIKEILELMQEID